MVKLMVSCQELDLQLVGILNTKIGGDPYQLIWIDHAAVHDASQLIIHK